MYSFRISRPASMNIISSSLMACCPVWLRPKKSFKLVWMPPAPVRVPSQRPLPPSLASVTSVDNDKDDNEMISWHLTYR